MNEICKWKFNSGATIITTPWPQLGRGDELPSTVAYGFTRSGSVRTYREDAGWITTLMQFYGIAKTVFDSLVTAYQSYHNLDIVLEFCRGAEGSEAMVFKYTGKIITPIMQVTHMPCDEVAFQIQFSGTREVAP